MALACHHCNAHKGPNLTGFDPDGAGDEAVRLFRPRQQNWSDHFESRGPFVVGRTAVGRATVHLLRMNDVARLRVRAIG